MFCLPLKLSTPSFTHPTPSLLLPLLPCLPSRTAPCYTGLHRTTPHRAALYLVLQHLLLHHLLVVALVFVPVHLLPAHLPAHLPALLVPVLVGDLALQVLVVLRWVMLCYVVGSVRVWEYLNT